MRNACVGSGLTHSSLSYHRKTDERGQKTRATFRFRALRAQLAYHLKRVCVAHHTMPPQGGHSGHLASTKGGPPLGISKQAGERASEQAGRSFEAGV